ncbi:uncharacterized protein EAF02_001022 [Botrytis sinoallii]|uniref:uncharacterized protein n=1 Tax=Botrytis sinoallii TaxID=1463999 RepID=UPI001901CBCF|nr:uncharacterized protein EAF02_001022 [Botrytis sinoallii]KAF7893484.1 hypothetical protein EAF02_001022 [Botrytis sinoallii]
MPEFQLPPLLIKIEQSLPYIISPILLFSLVLTMYINVDKSHANRIFCPRYPLAYTFATIFIDNQIRHTVVRHQKRQRRKKIEGDMKK